MLLERTCLDLLTVLEYARNYHIEGMLSQNHILRELLIAFIIQTILSYSSLFLNCFCLETPTTTIKIELQE